MDICVIPACSELSESEWNNGIWPLKNMKREHLILALILLVLMVLFWVAKGYGEEKIDNSDSDNQAFITN